MPDKVEPRIGVNAFDLSQFDEYREDNRREVKKAEGGLPVSVWDTYSSFANCYNVMKTIMATNIIVFIGDRLSDYNGGRRGTA